MKYSEKLKEGLSLELQVSDGEYPGLYKSQIEEIKSALMVIHVPIFEGQFIPLRPGTRMDIFFNDSNAAYAFKSQIINRVAGTLPFFIISYPKEIRRVQRRRFYRVPLSQRICFQVAGEEDLASLCYGQMSDLSGGGLSFTTDRKLNRKTPVRITIKVADQKFTVTIRIIRCERMDENSFAVAAEFQNLSGFQRDMIIAYVCEVQRLMLQKGLETE